MNKPIFTAFIASLLKINVNMFEHIKIEKAIYEGVVTHSYKKTPQ